MVKKSINLDFIKKTLSDHFAEFEKDYGVRELSIFGSYVRGEERKGSDVDLLVEFNKYPRSKLRGIHDD